MKRLRRTLICTFALTVLTAASASHATGATTTNIRVGVNPVVPPLCFVEDRMDGTRLRGLSIDVMEQAGKLMRAQLTYLGAKDSDQRWKMLKNEEIDAFIGSDIPENPPTDVKYISFGIELKRYLYVHHSCKTVVCCKDLGDKKVGILAGDSFGRAFKTGEIVTVLSEVDGLIKLNQGELDAFIGPSDIVAGYLIQKQKLTEVLRVGMPLDTMHPYIAVKADDPLLYATLAKAISDIQHRGVMREIEEKWHGVAFPNSYWSKYGRLFFLAVGFVGFSLCLVLAWNYQLKRQIRKVTLNLQISESKARALIESSPDMIFVIQPDGDIIEANKGARIQILGEEFGCSDSTKLTDYVLEEDKGKLQAFTDSIFHHGQAFQEFRFFGKAQSLRELSIAASPIAGEHPETGQIACFFARDVTERNRIERELVQADRMAIMGQMAAGIAHEINNPLGIVKANLELITSRHWFSKDAEPFVDAIRRNIERAAKTTKGLLAVTKPGNAVMAPINLQELVEMTLMMVKPQLKEITIKRLDIGLAPVVFGDGNLLQQVLVNIFLNAQNAMQGQKEPVMTVTCCSNPKESMARIKVMDNGAGIEKKLLVKIFEPFFTYAKKEGFGLGLFISQRIVERHNGIIYAESEPGKGTQIVIELPLMN